MRAAVVPALGAPLEIRDVARPEPGPGQVVVAVRAAGVNFVDALFVQGAYQIKPPLPFTPGGEVAGESPCALRVAGERHDAEVFQVHEMESVIVLADGDE